MSSDLVEDKCGEDFASNDNDDNNDNDIPR